MAAVAAASANAIGLIGTGNPNDPQSNQVWNRYSPHSGLSQSGPSTASPADQSVPDRYQYHAHLLSTTPNPTGFSPIELLDTKPKMKESKHEDSEGRCDLVQAVPGVSVALQPALSTVFDESSRTILQSDSAHDGKYEKIERPENFIISHASAGPSRTTIIDLPRVTSFKNTHQTSMNDSHISLGIKWDSLDYETVQKPPVAILSDGDLLRLGKASPPIRYSTTNSRSQIARRSRSFGLFSSSGPSPESLLGTEIEALPIYNPSILQQKIRLKNKFLEKVRDSKLANASMDVPQKNSNTLTVNSSIKSRKYFDTKVGDQDTGKWAKLRRSTIAQTGMATSDITLDAVFPEMKPQCNLSAEERKHRALEYWCKLRKAVFTYDQNKFEILGKLAITALPDLAKLHEKAQSNISDINVVVPYNTWSARMHWLFMCPAFDDDTEWMSIQKYHTWEYRLHKFSIDGFNPFSIFYSFCNGMLLCFYVYILVVLPYQIAYEDNIDDLIDTENANVHCRFLDQLADSSKASQD
ncbi:hypothetical protein BC830DRAFT_412829 [Chytriomyces sp. MP71]|nr:hypothetical protein BC830DRAFT_412829 [Chytriomyces sp. MP71]